LLHFLFSPLSALGYFFSLIGNPFLGISILLPVGFLIGLTGVGVFILTVLRLKKNSQLTHHLVMIWLGIMTYSLMTLIAITLSRCGFGVGHAMQSRYATHSNIFWISLLVLILIVPNFFEKIKGKIAFSAFAVFILLCFMFSNIYSMVFICRRYQYLNKAQQELFRLTNPQKLKPIFPFPNYLYNVLPLLFQQRQSVFRHIKQFREYHQAKQTGGNVRAITPEKRDGCNGVLMRGDISIKMPVNILLTAENKILYAFKPDSTKHNCINHRNIKSENYVQNAQKDMPNKNALVHNTFRFFVPNHFFPKKRNKIKLFVLNQKGEIFQLKPELFIKLSSLEPPEYDLSKKYYCLDFVKQTQIE
jgi:hypothetical protein